ncbi:MAG TPA: cupredoxin domain-containing protein [Methanoregula sp.]|nr:cupredoxin domain-containing protein [Methanoregula sp.]
MKKGLVLLAITAILVIACGCTQSSIPPQPTGTITTLPLTTQTPAVTSMPTPQKTTSVSDNTIWINKTGFYPSSITVKSGSIVRWVNADSTADAALYNPTHRIAVENIDNSDLLSPGQGWSQSFDQPGSYDYSDMIHTDMRGTVIVE